MPKQAGPGRSVKASCCLLDPGLATDELGYRDGPRLGLFRPAKRISNGPKLGPWAWALSPTKKTKNKV